MQVGGKSGRVVGGSDDDKPVAARHVVDAVGNGDAIGIARKIVDANVDRCLAPRATVVLEQADQLAFLGVNANDRQTAALKSVSKIAQVEKLTIAIRTVVGGQGLVIDAQRIAHLME